VLIFNDPRVVLQQEPFVAGDNTVIDRVVSNVPNAARGFTPIFSLARFPERHVASAERRADTKPQTG
jgi:hypothetical protein